MYKWTNPFWFRLKCAYYNVCTFTTDEIKFYTFFFTTGVTIKIIADEESNFKALFYQDPEMHMVYQAYPELIMIDATYKLVDLRLPLYLLMCVDGNGQSEIVGKCLPINMSKHGMH